MKTTTNSRITILLLAMSFCFASAIGQTYYVHAPSGLNFRSSSDPASSKLGKANYGDKVVLLSAPSSEDMTVDGLPGGMAKVRYDGQEGYMFDGFLLKWPTRKEGKNLEQYVEAARAADVPTLYEKHYYDFDGYYRSDEGIHTMEAGWEDAWLLGKSTFDIPKKLNFPGHSGKDEEVFINPDKDELAWSDELSVKRKNGKIVEMSYYWRGEGTGWSVSFSPSENSNGILIMHGSIAD